METGFVFAAGLLLARRQVAHRRGAKTRWSALLMLLLIGTLMVTISCGGGGSSSQQASSLRDPRVAP